MKKKEQNKLDKMVREIVRDDLRKCVICGKENINIHHIEGRRIRATRWYIPNLVALCPEHHTFGLFSAHQSPFKFHDFMLDLWGREWKAKLTNQSNKVFKGGYKDVENYLSGKSNNYC